MRTEEICLNKERQVTLSAYLQPVGGEFENIVRRPAVLVLPGGGYQYCSDREAEPVAMEYLRAGYQAFVLRYSLKKNAVWPNPLEDYEQAMALIREKAEEWNLYPDKIAVVGFSAGGHLAAYAATMSKNRPNAAILGYPVIVEENAHIWEKTAPDAAKAVDNNTCPCFVFASRDDVLVPVENTLQFTTALAEHRISFESHIYAYGPHGFSTADDSILSPGTRICNRAFRWVSDSLEWLKDVFGSFADGQMSEPKCKRRVNGNEDEEYSIDCTLGYLMTQPETSQMMQAMMDQAKEMMGQDMSQQAEQTSSPEQLREIMANMRLRDMLGMARLSEDVIAGIDSKLRQIPKK